MSDTREFDPMLDCYLSWEAFIVEMRRRWLVGEPIGPGPWQPKTPITAGQSTAASPAPAAGAKGNPPPRRTPYPRRDQTPSPGREIR